MQAVSHWVAFGDIHDELSRFEAIPELEGAAGVIVTGDITLYGDAARALAVLQPIAERVPVLFAQIGNMDKADVTGMLERQGWNLHGRARSMGGAVYAVGVGACPPTPFATPSEYPESRLADWLEAAYAEACERAGGADVADSLILIAHTPPYNTACDRLHSGAPVGSTSVRAFIEQRQPALCLCGHIHESRAVDAIGRTQIINPGTLGSGGYVVIRLHAHEDGAAIQAELKVLQ